MGYKPHYKPIAWDADPDHRRKQWRGYATRHYQKIKARVFLILGSECLRCSTDDQDVLALDHINGEGRGNGSRRRRSYADLNIWHWAARHPAEAVQRLQMLCWNCNHKKALWQNITLGL